jgi:predicted PurR-regulated permease PerM
MIMIVLRTAAVLIALFSLMNAAFNRDLAAFAFVHGLCALLGAIVAFLLAKFLNRSIAGWVVCTIFFVFLTLIILAFMPTSKPANMSETIGRLKKIVAAEPANSAARYHLGAAYLSVDDEAAATEQYESLKSLASKYAEKLLNKIYRHQANRP